MELWLFHSLFSFIHSVFQPSKKKNKNKIFKIFTNLVNGKRLITISYLKKKSYWKAVKVLWNVLCSLYKKNFQTMMICFDIFPSVITRITLAFLQIYLIYSFYFFIHLLRKFITTIFSVKKFFKCNHDTCLCYLCVDVKIS